MNRFFTEDIAGDTARITGEDVRHIARENAAMNGIYEAHYHIKTGDVLTDAGLQRLIEGKYDLVVANIVADIIIRLAPDAGRYMKPDGCFIVSGIIEERAAEVLEALSANGFHVVKDAHENGWYCACVQK